MIIGVDEVGRGCLAGPMVVGAVAIEPGAVKGLKDSKLLTAAQRNVLARAIRLHAEWIGIGWVSARTIDRLGLTAALKLAAERAVHSASFDHEIIVDGIMKLVDRPNVSTLKKADQLIPAVSAASIIAKVARDTYMQTVDIVFPSYGFKQHVGYATPLHRRRITEYGVSPLHRMCFAPVRKALGITEERVPPLPPTSGQLAEAAVAEYLEAHGFTVLERNWKTRFCEVDIIAEKHGTLYFTEVKYRKNTTAGSGIEYVTAKKQQQMTYAARSWVHQQKWQGDYSLAAAEVGGAQFKVTSFLSNIDAVTARHAQTM